VVRVIRGRFPKIADFEDCERQERLEKTELSYEWRTPKSDDGYDNDMVVIIYQVERPHWGLK
jgi:hypothetical protein